MRMTERRRLRASKKRDPAYFVRLQTLTELRDDAAYCAKKVRSLGSFKPGQTQAWKLRAITALTEILGEYNALTDEIDPLWTYETPADPNTEMTWREQHWREAEGILNTAITSFIFLNTKVQESTIANSLDAELIARVDHVFRMEDWTAVASLAATFVEDRFRVWAGLDHNSFGVTLMTKVSAP
jgi:hypothetical protein